MASQGKKYLPPASPLAVGLLNKTEADFRMKTSGIHRDTKTNTRPAWVVKDGNLITARWPGDVHLFAQMFLETVASFRLNANPSKD